MCSEPARRVMLVTGVSGEIGAFLAAHFASTGWRVLGVDRCRPARPLPSDVVFAECDLSDGAAATAVIDELAREHGSWEVLVNGAGLIANAPLLSLVDGEWVPHDFALWDRVVSASLTTAFHTTALTVKHMAQARTRGLIVNLTSVCAKGSPGQVAYSAAKAGVEGMTRALGKELGPRGIRVVALALGYFDTASMHAHVSETRLAKVVGAVPMKRLGVLPDVAGAIEYLIHSDYTTGTVVELNGGLVL